MFYDRQPEENKNNYKSMLKIVGSLSKIYSESDEPYLYYRCHENIFCKYFGAENLSREDCSADAKKDNIGIGLKTWIGADNQKVAEFNRLRTTYQGLPQLEMIKRVSEYRNERIRVTKNLHGINEMIYHIVKRIPNIMQIYECSFDPIDIDNITILEDRTNANNIYFTDNNHIYHFNISKSTLYMLFENMNLLDSFEIDILNDPYSYLEGLFDNNTEALANVADVMAPTVEANNDESICLRLYTVDRTTGEKKIQEKSGLNQWNASGRVRDPNEIYIPYPAEDRRRTEGFFPPRDTQFNLHLPDGSVITAKVCQEDGKAIMSNPNKVLGEWLLRDVFELPEGTILTYEMLERFGVDSVVFTKLGDLEYKIEFTDIGTYESMNQNNEVNDEIDE